MTEVLQRLRPSSNPPRSIYRSCAKAQTARAAVAHLQHMFNDFGEQPRFDEIGKFGPKTLAAVKKFQQGNHLIVDGVVGKNTWKALLEKWLPG